MGGDKDGWFVCKLSLGVNFGYLCTSARTLQFENLKMSQFENGRREKANMVGVQYKLIRW